MMPITSLHFLVFLTGIAILVYLSPQRYRKYLLVVASLLFYWFNQHWYVGYLLGSVVVNYLLALAIVRTRKRALVVLAVGINVGLLAFFKYLPQLFTPAFPLSDNFWLKVILPIGISFYTFQAIGYILDLYWTNAKSVAPFFSYCLYMMFFPQLMAGPIARSRQFLPQISKNIEVDYNRIVGGLRLILWGLFKKLVVADRLSPYTDAVFDNLHLHTGPSMAVAAVLYVIQLYCDFSGYSDIAIGSARILGFDLMRNFQTPLFSASVTDFWRRWHISLSSWVRDYVYTPLQYAFRGSRTGIFIALYTTFLIIGIWHGAKWNFVIFGALQGTLIIWEYFGKKLLQKFWGCFPERFGNLLGIVFTFIFFTISGVFLRSNTLADAGYFFSHITHMGSLYSKPLTLTPAFIGLLIVFFTEIRMPAMDFNQFITSRKPATRWGYYLICTFLVLLLGALDGAPFIYYQF